MYCPKCGQQQASVEVRFCSRCGFPLAGVARLLASGGETVGLAAPEPGPRLTSPRREGVRRGAKLVFLGCLLTPVAALLHSFLYFPELLIPLCAILGILGGILRMLYAAIFEEGRPALAEAQVAPASYLPPSYTPPALPQRNTAEIKAPPASVTENTTRLLKDQPPSGKSAEY